MKVKIFILALLIWMVALGWSIAEHKAKDTNTIISIMKEVADWQLSHPKHKETDWRNGALFAGIMALYEVTKDMRYLCPMIEMGERNRWQPGSRFRHADDHCIGQTYLDLYSIKKDPKMIRPIQERFDQIMASPKKGREDWWWCDALFMAPPTLVRLSVATGDRKYLDFMNAMWWDTKDFLYDREETLFFRDESYFIKGDGSGHREKNGRKIFWSRGNGWVMAGLVRVLQFMPDDYPDRGKYIALFQEMSKKVVSLQCKDGFWRTSLLDPDSYPGGETSGTGFFCYALAWGINNHILNRDQYLPAVNNAWNAIVSAVDESGKLGWVQQMGKEPELVSKESIEVYGVGAFLLAGSEMLKLRSAEQGIVKRTLFYAR